MFFYEQSLSNESVSPEVIRKYFDAALAMGIHDISQIPLTFKTMLSGHVEISMVKDVHENIALVSKSMGITNPDKSLKPDFLDASLIAYYQKVHKLDTHALQGEIDVMMAINKELDTPHDIALELLAKLEKENQEAAVMMMNALRKKIKVDMPSI